MKRMNYLGWLSLLSLISVLGWKSGNTGLYGFFGFIYFIRYFWVIPDVRKSATIAFMLSMVSLVPFMFSCSAIYNISAAIPMSFALSFAVSTIAFAFTMTGLEWKERRGTGE